VSGGGPASIYEYLKLLRGESFGILVSVLHGTTKVQLFDATVPAVTTTGVNWIVEPSHILFNNGASEVLLPLENVIAAFRSVTNDTLELVVRFPTADA
jgi:hypothetical protein